MEKLENVIFVGNVSQEIIFIGRDLSLIDFPVIADSEVPKNYDDFYVKYAAKIRRQVAGFSGIDRNEIDDHAQTIIMQFIAGDYLNVYNSTRQAGYAETRYKRQLEKFKAGEVEYAPVQHKGKFSSFLFEMVKLRLLGIRDRTNRRVQTMRSLDTFSTESEGEEATSLTQFIGVSDAEFSNLEIRQLLQKAYSNLCNATTATSTRDFPRLFLIVVNDAFQQGNCQFNREAYASAHSITVSAVSMQLRDLREFLRQIGFYAEVRSLVLSRSKQVKNASF